jgi:Family of unknown function (DUF6130)
VTRLRCVVLALESIYETPGVPRIAPRRGGVAGRGPRPTDGGLRSWDPALIQRRENAMTLLIKTLAAVAAGTVLATSAFAQSAREIRGASPYDTIENEPAPKLIVDPPLPGPLAQGIFQVQYRVENVRILPVFGAGALNASPRLGHLHINVDDLPWLWADASDNNTVDIAGLPPGEHKVKIELVDANHRVFPGQVVTVRFTVPAPSAPR